MRVDECEYIVISGAGALGACYIGVLRAMEHHFAHYSDRSWKEHVRSRVRGFAGTSAGAAIALVLCLGLDSTLFERICIHLLSDVTNAFQDPDLSNALDTYGIDNGKYMRATIGAILRHASLSEDTTLGRLAELTQKQFACVVTNLNRRKAVTFSAETHPQMRVVDAIFMSMCIPVMFVPQKYEGDLYVDGALCANTPRCYPPERTMHWCIRSAERRDIVGWKSYALALVESSITQDSDHDASVVVELLEDKDVCGFDFTVTHQTSLYVACGYASTLAVINPSLYRTLGEAVLAVISLIV